MSFAGSFTAIAARYGRPVVLFCQGEEVGQGQAVLRPVLDRQAQWVPSPLGKQRQEEVFAQMDQYTAAPHLCAVSLKGDGVGEPFWREEFLREVRQIMEKE